MVTGATGDAAERSANTLVDAGSRTGASRFVPSAGPLSVAVDGPGLFVFEDHGHRLFSRLGDFRIDDQGRLLDGAGRQAVGFRPTRSGDAQAAAPIAVDAADIAAHRFDSYRFDENGVLSGVIHRVDGRSKRRREEAVPLARLALAVFPVPERLARVDETSLVATRAAGIPLLMRPGEKGTGLLRAHSLAAGAVDIQADLNTLWVLRRKGELATALAGASDACTRTALGLVR